METKRRNRKRTIITPVCKYGAKCYRKDPEHKKNFSHPSSCETDSQKQIDTSQNEIENSENIKPPTNEKIVASQNENSENMNSPKERLLKLLDEYYGKERTSTSDVIPGCDIQKSPIKHGKSNPEVASTSMQQSIPVEADEDTDDEEQSKPEFLGDALDKKSYETVEAALKIMPPDFEEFWNFCATLNKAKPDEAFAEIGFHLVGVYDLLSKKLPRNQEVCLHCHWRYYYDPPEFQTVIKLDGNDLYHIGYFRDDPAEKTAILASNSAKLGAKLTLMGDNIFAAMDIALTNALKKLKSKKLEKFSKIQSDLQKYARKYKYSLKAVTAKTNARQKKVVAKTFHSLGIVVPIINDVGYRPLDETDASLKRILKKIVSTTDEGKKAEAEDLLWSVTSNVNLANDECDFGAGLELGIDLFCFGDPHFNRDILTFLPLAYHLLKREKYGEITHAHIKNRRKGDDLSDL